MDRIRNFVDSSNFYFNMLIYVLRLNGSMNKWNSVFQKDKLVTVKVGCTF